jgi:hypothetical protein
VTYCRTGVSPNSPEVLHIFVNKHGTSKARAVAEDPDASRFLVCARVEHEDLEAVGASSDAGHKLLFAFRGGLQGPPFSGLDLTVYPDQVVGLVELIIKEGGVYGTQLLTCEVLPITSHGQIQNSTC